MRACVRATGIDPMSSRPSLPLDPFGRPVAVPATLSRQDRVRLLAEAFDALVQHRLPSKQARLFLGGAGLAWLAGGGDFERDYLRVSAPPGSHFTPQTLARQLELTSSDRNDKG